MRTKRADLIRHVIGTHILVFCINDAAIAQAIDTGLFTQNRLRQCSSTTACIGGDPTLEVQSDFDLSVTGLVVTLVSDAALGAQAATSAGFDGIALTPALSAYAYTAGPQRYTLGSFGFQRYEFLTAGDVTIDGTLTFSQTGQTSPTSENARGRVLGSLMSFQMDGDAFDASNCNLFSSYSASNIAGTLVSCVARNGQFGIEFIGLQNYQEAAFSTSSGPVFDGAATATLMVSGQPGDVFFLGASLTILAHLAGFADTSNTLTIEIDEPSLVEPTFTQETFVTAPGRDIEIDVKPGSDPNCFNINGHGVIPVGILGSEAFDVLDIDQGTLVFGGLGVARCSAEYLNQDEFLDLACKFKDDLENWSPGSDVEASVGGRLIDGRPISGTDSICLVPKKR